MSLKTSFFNKAIFKSDVKRFWWVGVLETLVIILTMVFPFYNKCLNMIERNYHPLSNYLEWNVGGTAVMIIFAIGIGTLMFSFMHFSASAATLHSMPFKRKCLFWTKYITGLLMICVPVLINALVLVFLWLDPAFREFYGISDILRYASVGIIYAVVLYSLTGAVNMMTGNPIGTIIFTCGFAVLPMLILSFFYYFFNDVVYGCYLSDVMPVLEKIYILPEEILKAKSLVTYGLMTAFFTAGAYYLYKIRKIESFGEVVAFTWLKPVFIAIIAILSSMLGYSYFDAFFDMRANVYALIPLGLIGTIIAWMVSKKSISPKGILKPTVIYLCTVMVFIGVIKLDVTGFEKKVPVLSDIESASITYSYNGNSGAVYTDGGMISYKEKDIYDPSFTSEEDIKNVLALHKHLVDDRKRGTEASIPIIYKLKNGKTLARKYVISYDKDKEYLKPLYETPEYRGWFNPLTDGTEKEFISLQINDRRVNNGADSFYLYPNNPQMTKLIEAMQKDIANSSYEKLSSPMGASTIIYVDYKKELVYDKPVPKEYAEDFSESSVTVYVYQSFENTIAYLKEIGYWDKLPKASDIKSAEIYTWKYGANDNEKSDVVPQNSVATITDSGEIDDIYSLYNSMIEEKHRSDKKEEEYNVRVVYTTNNNSTFEVSCTYGESEVPEIFKQYF